MKSTLFLCLLLSFAFSQSFEQQLAQPHSSYLFSQDGSLIAAINKGSINLYDTQTKELKGKLEPEVPLCESAVFAADSLFAVCGHMLYEWDVSTQTLISERIIRDPYHYYEDFIFLQTRIAGINSDATKIATNALSCCDTSGRLQVWQLGKNSPIFDEAYIATEYDPILFAEGGIAKASFQQGQLVFEYLSFTGENQRVSPNFPLSSQDTSEYFLSLSVQDTMVLLEVNNLNSETKQAWLYDTKTQEELFLTDQTYTLSTKGKWLASSDDQNITIWNTKALLNTAETTSLNAYSSFALTDRPRRLVFSDDESHLLIQTTKEVLLLDLETQKSVLNFNEDIAYNLLLSPNANQLLYFTPSSKILINVKENAKLAIDHAPALSQAGFWAGEAEQASSDLRWQTNLFLSGDALVKGAAIGYVSYEPDYPCTSRLVYQDQTNTTLTLKETLITGQEICTNSGSVTLELRNEGLEWRFFRADGSFDSSAILKQP